MYEDCASEYEDCSKFINLDKLYDSKWENVSVSMKSIKKDMTEKMSAIQTAVSSIKAMRSDKEPDALALYERTLNLNDAIQMITTYEQNKAMMEFMYSTAVRVGELVKLNREDIRFSSKDLIVCGKGDKERVVYLNERTHMYLLEYLESRTDTNPALFVSLRSPYERLTDKGVEDIVRRTGRRVGVKAYPHKFRGTSITNALNRGMPLQEASCMAGHVKSDTTLRYAQLDQDSVRYHHKKYLSA